VQELNVLLIQARYEPDAWQQVTRVQSIQAASQHRGTSYPMEVNSLAIHGMMQAISEKDYYTSQLSASQKRMTVDEIEAKAREHYQVLARHLETIKDGFILGTSKPTRVDLEVWAHLAEASSAVTMCNIVSDYPALYAYLVRVHKLYFAGEALHFNRQANIENVFVQAYTKDGNMFATSRLDTSQPFSLKRLQEISQKTPHHWTNRGVMETWHRWRMGGGFLPTEQTTAGASGVAREVNETATEQDKAQREYQRNDQLWMTAVGMATIMAMGVSHIMSREAGSAQRE
jgi:uncharacterized protein YjhX (UPF0386 family)